MSDWSQYASSSNVPTDLLTTGESIVRLIAMAKLELKMYLQAQELFDSEYQALYAERLAWRNMRALPGTKSRSFAAQTAALTALNHFNGLISNIEKSLESYKTMNEATPRAPMGQALPALNVDYAYEMAYARWSNTTLLKAHISQVRKSLERRLGEVQAEVRGEQKGKQSKTKISNLSEVETVQTSSLKSLVDIENAIVDRLVQYAGRLWWTYYRSWFTVGGRDTREYYNHMLTPTVHNQAFTVSIVAFKNSPPSLRPEQPINLHRDLIPQLTWITKYRRLEVCGPSYTYKWTTKC